MNTFESTSAASRFKRLWRPPLLVTLIVGAGAIVWLSAETIRGERIGPNSVTPAYVVAGTSTPVTFTSVISDSDLRKCDPLKVLLIRTDASGKPTDILGRMLDNGKRADVKRNDHTYAARVTLKEQLIGPIYFKIAARFDDVLPRFGRDKDDDADWDRDLATLTNSRDGAHRPDRLPPLLRKLQGYTLSDPVVVTLDPFKLPPDPGEAGKQTIEGIDSDHDGVRDDVQRYIGYSATSVLGRESQEQYARALALVLAAASDPTAARAAWQAVSAADRCMVSVLDGQMAQEARARVRAKYLNTGDRSHAYLEAGKVSPTTSFADSVETGAPCAF